MLPLAQVLPNLRPGYVELARSIEVVASSGGGGGKPAAAAPAAAPAADGSAAADNSVNASQAAAEAQPAAASAVDAAAASGSEAGEDADSDGELGSDDDGNAGEPGIQYPGLGPFISPGHCELIRSVWPLHLRHVSKGCLLSNVMIRRGLYTVSTKTVSSFR